MLFFWKLVVSSFHRETTLVWFVAVYLSPKEPHVFQLFLVVFHRSLQFGHFVRRMPKV